VVSLSVMIVNHAKTSELIEMLLGTRNHVLDGVQISPREGAILRGKTGGTF